MTLSFYTLALIVVLLQALHPASTESQLKCLIKANKKAGMVKKRKLTTLAEKHAVPSSSEPDPTPDTDDNSSLDDDRDEFDADTPGYLDVRCTRSYPLVAEKHLCNDMMGSESGSELLEGVAGGKYVVKFGCAVGRKGDAVKACCARRTTKKKRRSK